MRGGGNRLGVRHPFGMAAACHLAISWIPAFNMVQRFYRENAWALVGKNI
jgi:hypothetical protein